jgi:protein phosphatase
VDGNRLNWALHLANLRVRSEMHAAPGRAGMATTVAAVLLENDARGPRDPVRSATIAHVGDSRIYRLRAGRIDRLTRDHSWVQDQVAAGLLSEIEARRHPRRNLLSRAISGGADPDVDIGWVPLAAGDRVILCTDGLSNVIPEEEMARIAGEDFDSLAGATACDGLVQAANLAGGPDNVTVIVVRL